MQVPPIRCLSNDNDLMSYDTHTHTYIHTCIHCIHTCVQIHSCVSVRFGSKIRKAKVIRHEKRVRTWPNESREALVLRSGGSPSVCFTESATNISLPVDRSDVSGSRWTAPRLQRNGERSFASTDCVVMLVPGRIFVGTSVPGSPVSLHFHFLLFSFLCLLPLFSFFCFLFYYFSLLRLWFSSGDR